MKSSGGRCFFLRKAGRPESNQIVSGLGELRERDENVLYSHLQIGIRHRRHILLDECRMLVRLLDTQRRYCAPAQTFEAQRAGAGEQLQHARANNPGAKAVEDRLFDEVGRRTNFQTFRRFQNPPCRFAAGDAHGNFNRDC